MVHKKKKKTRTLFHKVYIPETTQDMIAYLFKEVDIQSNNKYFADFGSNKLKDTNNKIMNLSSTSELNSLMSQMGIPIVK